FCPGLSEFDVNAPDERARHFPKKRPRARAIDRGAAAGFTLWGGSSSATAALPALERVMHGVTPEASKKLAGVQPPGNRIQPSVAPGRGVRARADFLHPSRVRFCFFRRVRGFPPPANFWCPSGTR